MQRFNGLILAAAGVLTFAPITQAASILETTLRHNRATIIALGRGQVYLKRDANTFELEVIRGYSLTINFAPLGDIPQHVRLDGKETFSVEHLDLGSLIIVRQHENIEFPGTIPTGQNAGLLTILTTSGALYQIHLVTTNDVSKSTIIDLHPDQTSPLPTAQVPEPGDIATGGFIGNDEPQPLAQLEPIADLPEPESPAPVDEQPQSTDEAESLEVPQTQEEQPPSQDQEEKLPTLQQLKQQRQSLKEQRLQLKREQRARRKEQRQLEREQRRLAKAKAKQQRQDAKRKATLDQPQTPVPKAVALKMAPEVTNPYGQSESINEPETQTTELTSIEKAQALRRGLTIARTKGEIQYSRRRRSAYARMQTLIGLLLKGTPWTTAVQKAQISDKFARDILDYGIQPRNNA